MSDDNQLRLLAFDEICDCVDTTGKDKWPTGWSVWFASSSGKTQLLCQVNKF